MEGLEVRGSADMEMNHKSKAKKKGVGAFQVTVIVGGILIVCAVLEYLFSSLLPKIGHPIFYFFSVLYCDSLSGAVVVFLFLTAFWYMLKKEDVKLKYKKVVRFFLLIAVVWMLILNLFPVSKEYKEVLIKGETPSRMAYKYNILLDAFANETKVENVPTERVSVFTSSYRVSGGKQSSGSNVITYYIGYETEENGKYASVESWPVWNYVEWAKEQKEAIQIEYYVHSGLIKSVDGIDKSDKEMLLKNIETIKEEPQQEVAQREEEEELLRQQTLEINVRRREIMKQSIGKDIGDVMQALEDENLPFIYGVKYISSQRYEINAIAFWDEKDVYVVRDDLGEDMIPMPNMKFGMSKEEIIAALTAVGFSYECDTVNCELHENGTLHSIGFGQGTLVPKGYQVWFCVDQ